MDEPNADVVRQLLGFVDKTSDLVGVVDANSRVVYLNEAARKRLGVGAASDLTTADVFPLEAFARYYEQVRPALLHTGRWEGELPVLTAAGDAVSMALSIVAGVGPGGEIGWLVTHGREIGSGGPSPRARDELTGLPRRSLLIDQATLALARATREGHRIALVFVDLDEMKHINEVFGDRVGDEVLREVAHRMTLAVREADTVARVGGDEFVLLLDGVRDIDEANLLAERVRDAIARTPIRTAGADVSVSASLGVVLASSGGDPDEMIRRADLAMYRAKASGPSQVATLDDELVHTVDAFAQELALAVSHGRVTPYVQPVVDLRSGQVVGYQGLARWQHRKRGLLAAGTFIDLVTDSAAAPVMDLAVLRDTAAVVARERRAGRRLRVYGHLSRRLLGDAELERYLVEIIEDLALTPEQFGAEIGRSLLVGSSRVLTSVLRALHDHGMRLVLSAPASDLELADAVQFGFDEVRLPPDLLAGIAEDAARARAVRSTITIAHGLGLLVTAVGVETEAVRDLLLDADCDLAAGELFGRPVAAREAGS